MRNVEKKKQGKDTDKDIERHTKRMASGFAKTYKRQGHKHTKDLDKNIERKTKRMASQVWAQGLKGARPKKKRKCTNNKCTNNKERNQKRSQRNSEKREEEKRTAETEAHGQGIFGLKSQRRVVELELSQ